MESRTKTWRAANRISFSEAISITHFAVQIFEDFLTNAIYHYSNRLTFAITLIVILLLAAFFYYFTPSSTDNSTACSSARAADALHEKAGG
jgi:peptidoglycan/LPS O-acetylase OafA/YrhL